jgi:hypothetical protein
MLPVVGLLAVLVARIMTTMAEGRRLAEAGFTAGEVVGGMSRVMAERAERRHELRANERVRRRRRNALLFGLAMLVLAVVMIRIALATRIKVGPTMYETPTIGVYLVFLGFALLGASFVLVVRSPFRMSPPERLFRWIWLGPFGRAFVRLSMWGAGKRADVRLVQGVEMPRVAWFSLRSPAPAASSAYIGSGNKPNAALAALEARVSELERWRRCQ